MRNMDAATVDGFGDEWSAFDQADLSQTDRERLFSQYFSLFPFDELKRGEGFDLGCGSGRWAAVVAPRVGRLHCIDPSEKALAVAMRNVNGDNVSFHQADAEAIPLADHSQDFGYSLGVLHHVPDTQAALNAAVRKLKPGAPMLLYLYYAMDNRPLWFRAIWRSTDMVRQAVSRLPFGLRKVFSDLIATFVYFPIARAALILERLGASVGNLPLSAYRYRSFYSMRTDALDRFGTRLERRFTKSQIRQMMEAAGLTGIRFRDDEPYWVAIGRA